jgi:hypothetical protein
LEIPPSGGGKGNITRVIGAGGNMEREQEKEKERERLGENWTYKNKKKYPWK